MIGYAALKWPVAVAEASAIAKSLTDRLKALGWSVAIDRPGWWVAAGDREALDAIRAYADDGAVLIGACFDCTATDMGRATASAVPAADDDIVTACRTLARRAWGAYVIVDSRSREPDRICVGRDPLGALDCVTWQCRGVRIVTSVPEKLLPFAAPAGLAIDWARVAELLFHPGSVGESLPLSGLTVIPPGTSVHLSERDQQRVDHWRPSGFCGAVTTRASDRPAALAGVVDTCVAAWGTHFPGSIAELSGGLDSAIVAAAIQARCPATARHWFQYHADDRAGDERRFADAVATHLALPLTTIARAERYLDETTLAAMPIGARPGLGSVSLFHDHDLADRAAALGARCVMTGQGGDAVFFQPATPLIAADLWSDPRPARDKLSAILTLASWTQSSVWTVLASAVRDRMARSHHSIPANDMPFVHRDLPRGPSPCRWLEDVAHLPPAKQLQIGMLAQARSAFGPSWCSQSCPVIHPLLSQPLVEHVLAIPAIDLTQGRRDRTLARQAYSGRLPTMLLERRGKGDLTPYFGRMLAASTGFLRSYLLDGALAEQHILDRNILEPMLTPDYLMQHNIYSGLITAILMEKWARTWAGVLGNEHAIGR